MQSESRDFPARLQQKIKGFTVEFKDNVAILVLELAHLQYMFCLIAVVLRFAVSNRITRSVLSYIWPLGKVVSEFWKYLVDGKIGFTGSAGTVVVTKDKAALWTDGRYFLQAEKQLNSSWDLMRAGNLGVPTPSQWLNTVLATWLQDRYRSWNSFFNLVDEIWKESRPKPPKEPIRLHDLKYAGVDVSSKFSCLRSELRNAGASAIVISMLDEIAWLLNLRGNDVRHSPVMYAYLVVEIDGAKLFVDDTKVTPEVMEHLTNAGIELRAYESVLSEIESLAAKGANLWLDTSSVNAAIVNAYESACYKYPWNSASKSRKKRTANLDSNGQSWGPCAVYMSSPVSLSKAVKNDAKLEGMRNCHLRDAAALAQFWAWLEDEIQRDAVLTEVEVADELLEFHSNQEGFLDTSIDTSGSGANGAIIHYRAESDSCSTVDGKKLFLLDSGGQYTDGTTDITRTVHFGEPSAREIECFTRVLQGHVALDLAVFPENTPDFMLDAFARSSLWKAGLDYRHGTGHGVGAALNVHEGPHSISFRFGNMTPLLTGMIVSNEPGYYEDHSFGIRIETKLVDMSLLSDEEVEWLNSYHLQAWEKVSPLLDGSVRQWLWDNTASYKDAIPL
ncbi:hypothetical protein RND71_000825 [Anisodus tanguticus]|uniref:Peptidase M24 domain-containing protein n=1 Tax=Anisodus tanguticus TaxID=243964 RepID=A0AAE1T0A5_9SOLA|nr:hypothetical protein RND71_000825 [Anisodus tanguticus]